MSKDINSMEALSVDLSKIVLESNQLPHDDEDFVIISDDEDLFENLSDEYEMVMELPEMSRPPTENLQLWLTDAKARDQYLTRAGQEIEVLWNDIRHLKPDPFYKNILTTDNFSVWSPLGTFLATRHCEGVDLLGGASTLKCIRRYSHPKVKFIDFSFGENFLVTCSQEPSNSCDSQTVIINIFDLKTGKLRTDFRAKLRSVNWPLFKWAGGRDDKYFARIGKNAVYVYQTATFKLLGNKSVEVENAMDISWSPIVPILAVYVPEHGNQLAMVSLYQMPSKDEIRRKSLLNVSDCKMYWQSNGEYLAVKVEIYTISKKSTYTCFDLFRINEPGIPIDVLQLENKNDKIIAFSWEPKSNRFAVIHGDNLRSDVSFYIMKTKTTHHRRQVCKLTTLKSRKANALYWSPSGRHIVLAGLDGFNGELEFYDIDELQTMAITNHFMCTDIEWDPSGRYVATAVTSVDEMENGFKIWSFSGKLLNSVLNVHFFQFAWRPRPPSLLSLEKEEEIAKNIKRCIDR